MNLIQQVAFGRTFREGLFLKTLFAGALDEISDLEIVFVFKIFFCHFPGLPADAKQGVYHIVNYLSSLKKIFRNRLYSNILANDFTARSGVG